MLSDAMQSVARRLGLSLVPYQSDWGFTAVRENDDRFFVFVLNSGEWSIYRAADVGLAERSSSPIRGDSTEPGWTPPPTTSPHNAGAGSKTPSWRGFLKFARVPQINVPPASSPTASHPPHRQPRLSSQARWSPALRGGSGFGGGTTFGFSPFNQ